MKRLMLLVTMMGILLSAALVSAQDDTPYLYYYSRMLGGLIIEHPDGSDSRLMGEDVIPADLVGIGGPGWSPSGKYFVAIGITSEGEMTTPSSVYLVDREGHTVNNFPSMNIGRWPEVLPARVQWSPTGEDILLVIGNISNRIPTAFTFLIFDASEGQTLAEYSGVYSYDAYPLIVWKTDRKQIRIYSHTNALNDGRYYEITVHFDGTVLKTPITEAEFEGNWPESTPLPFDLRNSRTLEQGISPSNRYEVHRNTLHNNTTGEDVELPTHSQGTICREYRWSESEAYILMLDGTAVAGGGCGLAVIGVTNSQGKLWRELGGCYWDRVCADWLPPQVEVDTQMFRQADSAADVSGQTSIPIQPTELGAVPMLPPTLSPN